MAEAKKFERKHFFIDRKLQGRYMVSFLIPMLIMLLFMIGTLYLASQSLIQTANSIIKDDIQNIITLQSQDTANPSIPLYKEILKKINHYIHTFATNSKYQKKVLFNLVLIFGIGILFVIIQLVWLTIFFSHKLAGPVYRFELVCHNLIEGKYTDKIVLRKGDEMQNLASLFNEAINKTRKRFKELQKTDNEDEKQKIIQSIEI